MVYKDVDPNTKSAADRDKSSQWKTVNTSNI